MKRRSLLIAALIATRTSAQWRPETPTDGPERGLRFPRDFGSHNDSNIEWWYVTGELHAGDELCGFQLTFFRSRTGLARDNPSRFAARQLILGHAAVTDLRAGRLMHAQRVARWSETEDETSLAYALASDTRLRLQDWSLRRSPQGTYRARLGDRDAGFAFELTLVPTQGPLAQGDAGLSRKGPGAQDFSHYYSEPQLAVSGTLLRGASLQNVQGKAWLDHEWSNALLPRDAVGWDWLGVNLDDGGALTAFQLRRPDGTALWAGGSHRPPQGTPRSFRPEEVRFEAGRRWESPTTHAQYPVEWTLQTPLGTHRVRALLDAQELDTRLSSGTLYWEGLSDLGDERGRRIGRGHLEMTGYANGLNRP